MCDFVYLSEHFTFYIVQSNVVQFAFMWKYYEAFFRDEKHTYTNTSNRMIEWDAWLFLHIWISIKAVKEITDGWICCKKLVHESIVTWNSECEIRYWPPGKIKYIHPLFFTRIRIIISTVIVFFFLWYEMVLYKLQNSRWILIQFVVYLRFLVPLCKKHNKQQEFTRFRCTVKLTHQAL